MGKPKTGQRAEEVGGSFRGLAEGRGQKNGGAGDCWMTAACRTTKPRARAAAQRLGSALRSPPQHCTWEYA